MKDNRGPVVPAGVTLPEITVKAVILSIVLAGILAAANAYLGLFAGMTVSASIPAAVASMAILRLFRRSNILENNIVQTAASSGEALAAGVIFTIPALLLVGYWSEFHYWQTTVIAAVGGLLGVHFTIPLRRALIVTAALRFPEGVATAEVLKVGSESGQSGAQPGLHGADAAGDFRTLILAATVGAAVKFGESGMRLWSESIEGAGQIGRSIIYGGLNLSPALLAVGCIIGLPTSVVVFLGGVLGWIVLLPIYGMITSVPDGVTALAAAKSIWSNQIRYIGIGAMLIGGLWTLTKLSRPVVDSVLALKRSYRASWASGVDDAVRTQRDASIAWLVVPFVVSLVPMAWIYVTVVQSLSVGLIMTGIMVVAAFLFSSVAAYMAGLVGSSSNPVSGVTIATIMLASLLLVLLVGQGHPKGPAAALIIGAVVCCAAAMGGDNLQDEDGPYRRLHSMEAASHASHRCTDRRGRHCTGPDPLTNEVWDRRGVGYASSPAERPASDAHGESHAKRVRGRIAVDVSRAWCRDWHRRDSPRPSAGGAGGRISCAGARRRARHLFATETVRCDIYRRTHRCPGSTKEVARDSTSTPWTLMCSGIDHGGGAYGNSPCRPHCAQWPVAFNEDRPIHAVRDSTGRRVAGPDRCNRRCSTALSDRLW
jgi:putative OPT family oligopeptide transporter